MSSSLKGKRPASEPAPLSAAEADGLEFEDEFEDEFEEEDMVYEEGDKPAEGAEGASAAFMPPPADGVGADVGGRLWRKDDALAEGEQLDFDNSAYDMLHRLHVEWPCLTFGVVKDDLGEQRTKYPLTAYVVAGTQAEREGQNKLICMKLSQLARTRHDDDPDEQSDDEDSEAGDEDALLESHTVVHQGTVNRLQLMPQASHLCATWAATGSVHVWDLSPQLSTLHRPGSGNPAAGGLLHTFAGHTEEGFAIGWSPVNQGALISGDCAGRMHLWNVSSGGRWQVDPTPFVGHEGSVEDVAWSPVEAGVLMSCGCDSTLRVWDARKKEGAALSINEGHGQDINVLSWNRLVNYLVVSGADDGSFRIWDLRSFSSNEPVAKFHWHRGPITSVEWSPSESSTIAVAGADNELSLWDLALEDDPEAEAAVSGHDTLKDVPPQLYFIHQGQQDIKEIHWHPQLPGVISSTAGDSFHIFKPSNHGDGPAQ